MSAAPKVYAFVLGYQNSEMSIACIRTLEAQLPAGQLVYLDNASEPEELAAVRAACPDIDVVVQAENHGYAAGWNAGMEYCLSKGADWILSANNDLEFADDAVAEMMASAERYPKTGMVTPKVYYHSQPDRIWCAGMEHRRFPPTLIHRKTSGPEQGEFDTEETLEYLTMCTVLCRREAVAAAGLLDRSFYFYCEDTDYSARIRKAGFGLVYAPTSRIWHKSPIIGDKREGKPEMWFNLGSSEVVFCRRHPDVYPGVVGWIHWAYLNARTFYEGGHVGLAAFRRGIREGRKAQLLEIPQVSGEPVPGRENLPR